MDDKRIYYDVLDTTDDGITQLTGDVTAGPGSGSQVATIAADAVTNTKLANMATQTIKGRTTAGTGDPQDLTATQTTAILNALVGDSGAGGTKGLAPAPAAGDAAAGKFLKADATWALPTDAGITQLTGDVTAGPGSGSQAATIPAGTVTFAKMANLATDRLIGRDTAGTGVPEALTVSGGVEFSGSTGIQTSAFTGDVTKAAAGTSLTIANDAVTFAKMQNIATDSLIGRDTASTGDPENILLNATLSMDGSGNLQRAALTGDVTASAGSNATTLSASLKTGVIEFIIDGSGATITTGVKGFLEIPFACTITVATLLADQSGSIVVNVWKDTYANFPPTVADKITASAPPTITTATKSQDSTLTGWTTSITAGDILAFNVDSATTIQRVTLSLKITRS